MEEHGITPDCGECKSIEVSGTRKGTNHSKGCCERFWNWTKAQAIEQPPKTPEKGPDLGIHHAPQEDKDEYEPDLEEPKPNVPGKLEVVPVNTSSSYRPFGDDVADILGMDDSIPIPERKAEVTVAEPPPKRVRYTRGCPACESGMEAPGIRHNAACKRSMESPTTVEISDPEPGDAVMEESTEGLAVDTEYGRVTSAKRGSERRDQNRECLRYCRTLPTSHSWQPIQMNQSGIYHCFPLSLLPTPLVLWCLLGTSISEFGNLNLLLMIPL